MNRVYRFQVRVLRSKKRIGLTRARLMGVEAATAPVLTFLGKTSSQDLFFSTNAFRVVMATLAKRKRTKASIMVFSSISKRSEHLRK
jgi:hypothetical protein